MAITTADVTKVKCIYFGAISKKIDTETYSILCKDDEITEVISHGKVLLFLYNISPTLCRSLECAILDYIETYSSYCIYCTTPCDREYESVNSE